MNLKNALKPLRLMNILGALVVTLTANFEPMPSLALSLENLPITVDPANYNRDCRPIHSSLLGSDYEAYLASPTVQLDEQGVLVIDYGNRYDDAGLQYTATTVATVGLIGASAWCERGDLKGLQLAVNQAAWLMEHTEDRGDFVTWLYRFPNPSFLSPSEWSSGLGNGLAIVLLTQLYLLSGDIQYLHTAQQAVNSYLVDIDGGGVRSIWGENSVVFEEVAHPEAPLSFVLNGHIIAVDSLAFYADATGDSIAAQLTAEGIEAVKNHLDDFDVSTIALYSLGPIPWGSARTHYAHGIHIRGLFWMYTRTGDPIFLQYAFDWQRYKWPPLVADLYRNEVSVDTLIAHQPDLKRWLEEPANTKAFVLDLGLVQPVQSFGYSMDGPYPINYTVEISQDNANWHTVAVVDDYNLRHGTFTINDSARYIRLSLGELFQDNPYYDVIANGAYQDYLLLGVVRADNAAYWEEPVLLITDGETDYDEAQLLRDDDPQTTVSLPADSVIYADLRTNRQLAAFYVEATPDASTITRKAWAEISDDMVTWKPLIDQNDAIEVTLPGAVFLPETTDSYRYLRLHLDDDTPLLMTEVKTEFQTSEG